MVLQATLLKQPNATKVPRPEHPRPDWVRPSKPWHNLNGSWGFAFDDNDRGLDEHWWKWDGRGSGPFTKTITVPYAHQTALSGINDKGVHEVVWYGCTIEKPSKLDANTRILLHFGAVDYEAQVWVAGSKVAEHTGGHVPFHCDITPYVTKADTNAIPLVVRARDGPHDVTQPRGKQYWKGKIESIWYYPTTGIWQTVWLEHVPLSRIERATIRTDIDDGSLTVYASLVNVSTTTEKTTAGAKLQVEVSLYGVPLATNSTLISNATEEAIVSQNVRLPGLEVPELLQKAVPKGSFRKGLALWSPESPALYDLTLTLLGPRGEHLDVVKTYTGMRKIHIQDGKVYLNNARLFQALNLDQGYWPKAGLTAPTDEELKLDIEQMKAIGMNGCRKHQKIEDPRFMYWADKLGYLVWGEMPSPQTFSQKAVERFEKEWTEAVLTQINHPCIISWTPYNESWGVDDLSVSREQRNRLNAVYFNTKTLDPTRLIIPNDGWEQGEFTDMIGFHDYSEYTALSVTASSQQKIFEDKAGRQIFLQGDHYKGQPILCTEFGGVSLKRNDGSTDDGSWGYNEARDTDDLLDRMRGLVSALVDGGICQGFCYTQTTDTEQEVNGILTIDRKYKIPKEKLKTVFGRRPSW